MTENKTIVPPQQAQPKVLKTYDVVDKKSGLVWKSDRNHNATSFNNHEVVRPTANIMSKVQTKFGVTETTINAKKFIAFLLSSALDETILHTELTAPMPEIAEVQPVAEIKEVVEVAPVVEVQPIAEIKPVAKIQAVADVTQDQNRIIWQNWIVAQHQKNFTDEQIKMTMATKMTDDEVNTYFIRSDKPQLPL